MTKTLTKNPAWLRVTSKRLDVQIDREANVLRGYVVAQEGDFKSEGRGHFDVKSLKSIVTLMNKKGSAGLKSRLAHPTLSDDGIGKFLGRAKSPRMDSVKVMRDGKEVLLQAVRADLHFDATALDTPIGGGKPLGIYVMDLAESDPDALSSSLVLHYEEEERLDSAGNPLIDETTGDRASPIWRPTELHASDVVDTGDAVDGILSASGLSIEGLPDELARRMSQLLGKQFAGASREVVAARIDAWAKRFLAWKFGDEGELCAGGSGSRCGGATDEPTRPTVAALRRRLDLLDADAAVAE